jgi:hypothetical protein
MTNLLLEHVQRRVNQLIEPVFPIDGSAFSVDPFANLNNKTQEVAMDVDLLDDHIRNMTSVLGLNDSVEHIDQLPDFLNDSPLSGTVEDQDTLLALIQQHTSEPTENQNFMVPPSEEFSLDEFLLVDE